MSFYRLNKVQSSNRNLFHCSSVTCETCIPIEKSGPFLLKGMRRVNRLAYPSVSRPFSACSRQKWRFGCGLWRWKRTASKRGWNPAVIRAPTVWATSPWCSPTSDAPDERRPPCGTPASGPRRSRGRNPPVDCLESGWSWCSSWAGRGDLRRKKARWWLRWWGCRSQRYNEEILASLLPAMDIYRRCWLQDINFYLAPFGKDILIYIPKQQTPLTSEAQLQAQRGTTTRRSPVSDVTRLANLCVLL